MAKRPQRLRVSGLIPYGSRLAPDGINLLDEPEEQRAVALIKTMRAARGTTGEIDKELQRQGTAAAEWVPLASESRKRDMGADSTLQMADASLPISIPVSFEQTISHGNTTVAAPHTSSARILGHTIMRSTTFKSTTPVSFTDAATISDQNSDVLGTATSSAFTQLVNQAATTTALTASAAAAVFGQQLTRTAAFKATHATARTGSIESLYNGSVFQTMQPNGVPGIGFNET